MTSTIPQLQIHGVNDLRLDQLPAPVCGDDDVVVEVKQCGICGSDLGFLSMGGLRGDQPTPIGHELWGLVSDVGVNVADVFPGQRVVVQPLVHNNNIGNGGSEGGFSPSLLVRGVAQSPDSLLHLPDTLPDAYGALVEPLSVAQHGANRVSAGAQDQAVIFGAGPIGLSILLVLQYRGLENIVVIDLSEARLTAARALGAVALSANDPDLPSKLIECHGSSSFFGMPMPGSSVYFEATGVRSVFERIVEMSGPGSRVCLTGVHKEKATLDLIMLLAKEISIISAMGYDVEFPQVIEMLQSGRFDPTVLVTHHFPLSQVTQAFEVARDSEQAIKVMIDCQA